MFEFDVVLQNQINFFRIMRLAASIGAASPFSIQGLQIRKSITIVRLLHL